MKKGFSFLFVILCIGLCGCISEEDKGASEAIIDKINGIETVTLEKADDIYNIYLEYDALNDKQKRLVNNYDKFTAILNQLEEIIIDEEIKSDPTNSITKEELVGIWQERGTSTRKRYFYYVEDGRLYYMAYKEEEVTSSDFTSKYLVASEIHLGEYNKDSRKKEGTFFCIPAGEDCYFSVIKGEDGSLRMEVINLVMAGTYIKLGEKVKVKPEKCQHNGCSNEAVTMGNSKYCEEHSNKCAECKRYTNEDTTFCIECIANGIQQGIKNGF